MTSRYLLIEWTSAKSVDDATIEAEIERVGDRLMQWLITHAVDPSVSGGPGSELRFGERDGEPGE
jgi:hypothetical protein